MKGITRSTIISRFPVFSKLVPFGRSVLSVLVLVFDTYRRMQQQFRLSREREMLVQLGQLPLRVRVQSGIQHGGQPLRGVRLLDQSVPMPRERAVRFDRRRWLQVRVHRGIQRRRDPAMRRGPHRLQRAE